MELLDIVTPCLNFITTYDANSNQLSYSYDRNGDGTTSYAWYKTYDANGNLLSESYDYDGDGTPDSIITNTNTYY